MCIRDSLPPPPCVRPYAQSRGKPVGTRVGRCVVGRRAAGGGPQGPTPGSGPGAGSRVGPRGAPAGHF
eukprot:3347-Alexandrium_andersonii.AAC.1